MLCERCRYNNGNLNPDNIVFLTIADTLESNADAVLYPANSSILTSCYLVYIQAPGPSQGPSKREQEQLQQKGKHHAQQGLVPRQHVPDVVHGWLLARVCGYSLFVKEGPCWRWVILITLLSLNLNNSVSNYHYFFNQTQHLILCPCACSAHNQADCLYPSPVAHPAPNCLSHLYSFSSYSSRKKTTLSL